MDWKDDAVTGMLSGDRHYWWNGENYEASRLAPETKRLQEVLDSYKKINDQMKKNLEINRIPNSLLQAVREAVQDDINKSLALIAADQYDNQDFVVDFYKATMGEPRKAFWRGLVNNRIFKATYMAPFPEITFLFKISRVKRSICNTESFCQILCNFGRNFICWGEVRK